MKSFGILILYRDIIALITTVFFSLILFFYNDSKYVSEIESDLTDLYYFIVSPQSWYKNLLSVKKQNQILNQKLTELNLINSRLNHFRIENIQLRKMLRFSSMTPLNLTPANISNYRSSIVQTIIIDRGKNSGIELNLPVIDMQGLIGKTISLGEKATKVQLITDKNYRVSIRIGKEKSLGIFMPTHGKFGVLEGVRKSMALEIGEIAYTSGISDIYPSNIPVAEVISIDNNSNHAFKDVMVEILANINDLNYVFVVQ